MAVPDEFRLWQASEPQELARLHGQLSALRGSPIGKAV
jgi:hypothetical protein